MFFLDPHTLTTIGKTGTTLYQHRKEILSSLAKIRRWIKHHNHMIVIFGPGGTGKSTLGLLLSGKPIHEINAAEFVESRENEPYTRPGQGIYKIQVAPGQDRYRQYWRQLYAEIAKSNRIGIINVVSYGYHSIREHGYQDITSVYHAPMTEQEFLQAYLQRQRDKEIAAVNELVQPLSTPGRQIFMITLVTKQDLWWSDRSAVKDWYETGSYNAAIEQISHNLGGNNFQHDYLSASLVTANFKTGKSELLAPTTAGYEQSIQFAHWQHFLDLLEKRVK